MSNKQPTPEPIPAASAPAPEPPRAATAPGTAATPTAVVPTQPGAAPSDSSDKSQPRAAARLKGLRPLFAFDGDRTDSLRFRPGRPATLRLTAPNAKSWEDVSIGNFVVRLAGGVQETIAVDAKQSRGPIKRTFPGNAALIMLCTGPKNDTRSDAWAHVTHCNKTFLTAAGNTPIGDDDATSGVLDRAMLPLEVTPQALPTALRPGDEMTVRVDVMGKRFTNAPVQAIGPDGSVDWQVSDHTGLATFKLPRAGKYVIRFAHTDDDGDKVGEFVFEIRAPQLRERQK